MFTKAIVRTPCRAIVNGIGSENPGTPDFDKALLQHADYIDALKECGLEVSVLPADESLPDSTFVGDAALLTPRCAILTRQGTPSQSIESQLLQITISKLYGSAERIAVPGHVDTGDIMMAGDHYYIGVSECTNRPGAEQIIEILERHDMRGSIVEMDDGINLKTAVSYLDSNNLLAWTEFPDTPEFQHFNLLKVNPQEAWAANSVWINGTVLTPAGYPNTASLIESAGYKVRQVDVSEFRKLDGGLSSLSLRF